MLDSSVQQYKFVSAFNSVVILFSWPHTFPKHSKRTQLRCVSSLHGSITCG